jgi:hypothetical protein
MLHRVVRQKFTDVSEMLTASITRTLEPKISPNQLHSHKEHILTGIVCKSMATWPTASFIPVMPGGLHID